MSEATCATRCSRNNDGPSIPSPLNPPPSPGHFVGHLSFFQIMLQILHGGVSSYVQIPMVGLLEECKRLTQTALSRVTDDPRSNLTDSIIQLSEKDQYDLGIELLKS